MSKVRRAEVAAICDALSVLRERLDALVEAEQEAFDAMPESFQDGKRGEVMLDAIASLEDCRDGLENTESDLRELAES